MSSSVLPNFLIVGAAKAGTTSLHRYLNEHPRIFLSEKKEPLFFVKEMLNAQDKDPWMQQIIRDYPNGRAHVNSWEEYLQLFAGVEKQKAIGEASATYLYYHEKAIPEIRKKLGDVRIIIVLRDPIKKVLSHYKYLKRGQSEPLGITEAVRAEEQRLADGYCSLYQYKAQCLYTFQVKAYMSFFSKVKVVLSEDLKKDTDKTVGDIHDFLEVERRPLDASEKFNVSNYAPKSQKIQHIVNFRPVKSFRKNVLSKVAPALYEKMRSKVKKANAEDFSMPEKLRQELRDYFKEDVKQLESLIQRDLSHWLQTSK